MKKKLKVLFMIPIAMMVVIFSGCSNNTDGTDTPLLLLPYTPRGEDATADLLIKAHYDTSEVDAAGDPKYGGYWYGIAEETGDETIPYIPIEDDNGLNEEGPNSLKILVRIDNSRIAENHWPYTSDYDNSNNFVPISDLPIGFHHLDIYIPGFSVMSRDVNVIAGQNYLDLTASPVEKKYESYFPYISGLIYKDSVVSMGTKRFMNFPIKVYLGRYVESDSSTGGSGEVLTNGYSEITNEASLMDSLEIDTPSEDVLNECRSNVVWALNEWGNACSKLSYKYTNDPATADLSIYWTDDTTLLSGGDALGVTYTYDINYKNYASSYSYKPVVFLSLKDPVLGKGLMNINIRKHTYLHEIGHALGLWGHSPYEHDIMYAYEPRGAMNYFIEDPKLSQGDINSINQLYELTPVFTNLPINNYMIPDRSKEFWPEWIN